MLLVPEVLGEAQPCQPHAQPGARWLVHLPEHEGGLLEHPGLLHLVIEIIALTCALPHASEHRVPAVLRGHVADELHEDHRLADSCAPEEPDLPTLEDGADEVDDLDPGLQHLRLRGLLREWRRVTVDGVGLRRLHGRKAVDRLAEHVEHATQCLLPHGNGDRALRVLHRHPALQSVRRTHGHRADRATAQVLLDFEDEDGGLSLPLRPHLGQVDPHGIVDRREISLERAVDDGTDHLRHVTLSLSMGHLGDRAGGLRR